MSKDIFKKLATVLDTLPNGFPATEDGLEIKILKEIFEPDEAELFCRLTLNFETADTIAERTGLPIDGLEDKLVEMWNKGQVFGVDFGTAKLFKMVPWVFGIYEFQLNRLTKEFAHMVDEYMWTFGPQFAENKPQMMQILPIEEEIDTSEGQAPMPYEAVSKIIGNGVSFAINDCICKKEMGLLDEPCDKPIEVCLAIAPVPGIFDNNPQNAREITKEEAYEVLRKSEEAGLVHMTGNYQNGHFFICNCCGCCCGILKGINKLGMSEVVNTAYYAQIDEEECVSCGICLDDRCQIEAILEKDVTYEVIKDKCIGCGLCITTCPSEAIKLIRKNADDIEVPVVNEKEWFRLRGEKRGVDISKYL